MQARVLQKTRAYSRRKEKKNMLSTIEAINNAVNNFIWGVPAMICIIGVGLVLSFRTGFLQIRKFPYAMKVTFGRMFKKREASDGAMTPFQAVCTALAGTVGTDDCDKVPFLERQAHTAKGFFLVRGVREEGLMKMSDLKHRLPPNAS